MVGVAPQTYTLRELVWMAEGKGKEAWGHTAAILALLANIHRDPKRGHVFAPADFNPYAPPEPNKPIPKMPDLSVLKSVFVDQRKGAGHA